MAYIILLLLFVPLLATLNPTVLITGRVQMNILVKKIDAGRPLFLSIACEELRVFGEFRHVTDKIRTLSGTLSGLVDTVSVDVSCIVLQYLFNAIIP